jgi:hypothetical protein
MTSVWMAVLVFAVLWVIGMGFSLSTVRAPGVMSVGKRLWCNDLKKEADVEFVTREGVPVGVRRCSLVEGDEITCGQSCLVAAVAHAA